MNDDDIGISLRIWMDKLEWILITKQIWMVSKVVLFYVISVFKNLKSDHLFEGFINWVI